MTRLQAKAYAPAIRVNLIAPGMVSQSAEVNDETWKNLINKTPLQKPVPAESIAEALAFLITNGYITGQTLVVDSGYQLR
jgi:NAD(P)-dependent dehydrogenase (short-subunit alcohol dehydrogenase family)